MCFVSSHPLLPCSRGAPGTSGPGRVGQTRLPGWGEVTARLSLYPVPLRTIEVDRSKKEVPTEATPVFFAFMASSSLLLIPCHMSLGTQCLSAHHLSLMNLANHLGSAQVTAWLEWKDSTETFRFLKPFLSFLRKRKSLMDMKENGNRTALRTTFKVNCFELWPNKGTVMVLLFPSFTKNAGSGGLSIVVPTWSYSIQSSSLSILKGNGNGWPVQVQGVSLELVSLPGHWKKATWQLQGPPLFWGVIEPRVSKD